MGIVSITMSWPALAWSRADSDDAPISAEQQRAEANALDRALADGRLSAFEHSYLQLQLVVFVADGRSVEAFRSLIAAAHRIEYRLVVGAAGDPLARDKAAFERRGSRAEGFGGFVLQRLAAREQVARGALIAGICLVGVGVPAVIVSGVALAGLGAMPATIAALGVSAGSLAIGIPLLAAGAITKVVSRDRIERIERLRLQFGVGSIRGSF